MSTKFQETPPASLRKAEREASRHRVEQLARTTAKQALRGVGTATAALRPMPDFVIVGTKRGGTTSLWRYLCEHEGVMPLFPRAEKLKGLYYFDEESGRGPHWYRSHFPTRATRALAARRLGHPVVAGEASPYYLYHPLAPARARQVAPDALIIAVLRDPVERAYSHFKERRSNGTEPLTFEEALDAEAERLAGEEKRIVAHPGTLSFAHRHQSYVDQGRYAPMLERWFEAFGRDRVMVEISEEMYASPQATVDRVTARLGLPARLLEHPEPYNAEPDEGFDPAVRARLRERLAPGVAAVEAVLGRSLPWPAP